jgi:hypothetical protein
MVTVYNTVHLCLFSYCFDLGHPQIRKSLNRPLLSLIIINLEMIWELLIHDKESLKDLIIFIKDKVGDCTVWFLKTELTFY